MTRVAWWLLATTLFIALCGAALQAPEFLSSAQLGSRAQGPFEVPPFGTDARGIPLLEYALQGAAVVTGPALMAALVTVLLATLSGLVRAAGWQRVDRVLHAVGEVVGALPRMVVILVVALLLPARLRSLMPVALTWALLSAPSAMDEAAAVAERIGGARFVEALRAHGFSAARIYGLHVVGYNLRPVLFRQGAEMILQIVFLEIALSYLAVSQHEPALTHPDSSHSWASLLYLGYTSLLGAPVGHALVLSLGLIASVALFAHAVREGAKAR